MKLFKVLQNPFEDISQNKLIVFGISGCLIGILAAYFLGGSYPGLISFKSNSATLLQLVYQNVLNTTLMSVVLFGLGMLLYPKTRFLDILITVLIARCSIYLMALLNINSWLTPIADDIAKNVVNTQSGQTISKVDLLILFLGVIVLLMFLIYFFYLLIKGFRIAINSKKGYHAVLLLLIVFIAEALASTFIPYYIS